MPAVGYASALLRAKGEPCTILRAQPVTSRVLKKRSTKAVRDVGVRDAYWEGLILVDSALGSGEVLQVGGDFYLVQSAMPDHISGEVVWFAAKTNAVLNVQRQSLQAQGQGGKLSRTWQTIASDVRTFGEVITASLRQSDPGLLDQARYLFQAPKSIGIQALDRVVYGGRHYQVESVDDVALAGVVRIQLGEDNRP